MRIFQKPADRDFVVLNLSDPQMTGAEWADDHPYGSILTYTITQLIRRSNPDLITVTGDIAYPGEDASYERFAQLLDGFGIPWAVVWGNHDHQGGIAPIQKAAELFRKHPLCQFEAGDPALGNGNYILGICEGALPLTALFLIDSHCGVEVTLEHGEKKQVYDKLWPNQLDWISREAAQLKRDGFQDAVLLLHIPPYCYHAAALSVFPEGRGGDSEQYGQQHELIASHPFEDGVLPVLKQTDLITHVLAGHDHCNNFMIDHEGIRLMFACKTGPGCYWQEKLNGGTVITVNSRGVQSVRHEFVDVSHLTRGQNIPEFTYRWTK